jgi:hypothetical protein
MKVVDSFLPKAYEDALEDMFFSPFFSWYYNSNTVNYHDFKLETTINSPQFTHIFFKDGVPCSEHIPSISVLLHHIMLTQNIRTDNLARIKANLNFAVLKAKTDSHYGVHTDMGDVSKGDFMTFIYYVNDCDGDTIMFDPKSKKETNRISPKKGRLVYFDSTVPHAGQPPKDSFVRCILNINVQIKETK